MKRSRKKMELEKKTRRKRIIVRHALLFCHVAVFIWTLHKNKYMIRFFFFVIVSSLRRRCMHACVVIVWLDVSFCRLRFSVRLSIFHRRLFTCKAIFVFRILSVHCVCNNLFENDNSISEFTCSSLFWVSLLRLECIHSESKSEHKIFQHIFCCSHFGALCPIDTQIPLSEIIMG